MADSLLFCNATVLLSDGFSSNLCLRVSGGEVAEIAPGLRPLEGEQVVNCAGGLLVPPVLDMHVHGGGGHSFLVPPEKGIEEAVAEVRAACRAQYLQGTRWLLATLPLSSPQTWRFSLEAVDKAMLMQRKESTSHEARILGAYLEGPFLNPQMAGGMEGDFVSLWNPRLFQETMERFAGVVRVVTVAPESPFAEQAIQIARQAGALIFMGHSRASFEEARRAIGQGVSGATHIFNAMAPYHHREPGVLGAALLSSLHCELIAELAHLHPASWMLALKVKGEERLVAVSDGSPLACSGKEALEWGGVRLLRKETASVTPEGRLCGTAVSLLQGLAFLHRYGVIPFERGIRLATVNPGGLLGIKPPWCLYRGYRGALVLLDLKNDLSRTEVFG